MGSVTRRRCFTEDPRCPVLLEIDVEVDVPEDVEALLVDVIANQAGPTGTKFVADRASRGDTCWFDGTPDSQSPDVPRRWSTGKTVTTVEGVSPGRLHPVQRRRWRSTRRPDAGNSCTPASSSNRSCSTSVWRKANGGATPSREAVGSAFPRSLPLRAYDNILEAVALACAGAGSKTKRSPPPRVEAREGHFGAAKSTLSIFVTSQQEGLLLRSQSAHAHIVEVDLAPAFGDRRRRRRGALAGRRRIVRDVGGSIAAVAAKDPSDSATGSGCDSLVSEPLPSWWGWTRRASPALRSCSSVREKAGGQRLRGDCGADPVDAEHPRPDRPFFAWRRKARSWISGGAGVSRSAPGRRDVPNRRAVPHMSRAACRRRPIRQGSSDASRFHAGGLSPEGPGRKALQTQPRSRDGHRASCRRRLRLESRARGRGDRGDRTGATGQGAGSGRIRPAGGIDGHRLSAGGENEGRAAGLARWRSEGPLNDGARRYGAELNSTSRRYARLIYPAQAKDLARLRRGKNVRPAAEPEAPGAPRWRFRPSRRSMRRLLVRPSTRSHCANAGTPILIASACTTGIRNCSLARWTRQGAETGRFRRGVGVAAGYWLVSGNPAPRSICGQGGRIVVSTATQDIGTGSRTVLANTVAQEFGLDSRAKSRSASAKSGLPVGPTSGGSRTTASIVPPALLAVRN